jgi:transcription elongation factor GreA
MEKFPITKNGFVKMQNHLKHLKQVERPLITSAIASARELGDLSENAEYHAAREKQSFVESKIKDLDDKIARSEIIDIEKLSGDRIQFGATVELVNIENDEELVYIITGEYESNIAKRMISISSPIAKGLIGKVVGDIIEIHTPGGKKSLEVISINYKNFDI